MSDDDQKKDDEKRRDFDPFELLGGALGGGLGELVRRLGEQAERLEEGIEKSGEIGDENSRMRTTFDVRIGGFGQPPSSMPPSGGRPRGARPRSSQGAAPTSTPPIDNRGNSDAESLLDYRDIGGLKPQLRRIHEMIELPLRHPEIFDRLGIDPPRGLLLHGPPGCGKTLTARAIARSARATFHAISGPEVIQKFYGESEAALRAVFERAAKERPAIIFLDEIDSLAPRREDAAGDVERRVVATLLTLMDGLSDRGQVMVIGATNRPNAIDPALRRPGRFDREIAIPVPDRIGRREILAIHSRRMPLSPNVSLDYLAEITNGFVGADLEAFCREGALAALRRTLPSLEYGEAPKKEDYDAIEVTAADFHEAFREITPSATREVHVEVPDVRWEDVGGQSSTRDRLIEAVEWPLHHADLFSAARVRPSRGIMLAGPPGVGKTMLARASATETRANFISVKGPSLMDKFVGESERNVRDIFQKARQAAPCIIFFDEIDAIAPARGAGASMDGGVSSRVLAQLLTEIDGVEELEGVLVLAATNRIDMIDEALLRPGRFDEIIHIERPDERARAEIFDVHLRDKPLGEDVDVESLARLTSGFVGSEIAEVCRRAALQAMRGLILASESGEPPDPVQLMISNFQLMRAIEEVRERLGARA